MLNIEHYEHSKKKHLMGAGSLQEFPVVILAIFTPFIYAPHKLCGQKRPSRKPLINATAWSESHTGSVPASSRLARGDHRCTGKLTGPGRVARAWCPCFPGKRMHGRHVPASAQRTPFHSSVNFPSLLSTRSTVNKIQTATLSMNGTSGLGLCNK